MRALGVTFLVLVGLAIVVLVYIWLWRSEDATRVLCPINYNLVAEDCQVLYRGFLSSNPDPRRYEYLPALQLQQNQAGIYTPPGDKMPVVVRGIGYQVVPATYTAVYPTNLRTYKTGREWKDPEKCPLEMQAYGECDIPLDNVRLKGGVGATVDYEIDFTVVIDSSTTPALASFGGHRELLKRLTSYVRAEFRNAPEVDPQLYFGGDLVGALKADYRRKLASWQYAAVVDVRELRIRSIDVVGIDAAAPLQNEQGLRNAEAFATQQAIACGQYRDESARAYCMAVYTWSQKRDAPGPLAPPVPAPTPAPAVAAPTATPTPKR